MAKILDLLLQEFSLRELDLKPMLPERFKHLSEMGEVLAWSLRHDEDIIKVHEHKIANELFQHLIHHFHERGWCIGQSHRQDTPLIVAKRGREGCLRGVLLGYGHLVEATGHIKSREVLRTTGGIKKIINPRQRIPQLDREVIERPVVQCEPETSPWLWHKQDWSAKGRVGRGDDSLRQEFSDLSVQLLELKRREPVVPPEGSLGARNQLDGMLWEINKSATSLGVSLKMS
jgi:hypothetical protein